MAKAKTSKQIAGYLHDDEVRRFERWRCDLGLSSAKATELAVRMMCCVPADAVERLIGLAKVEGVAPGEMLSRIVSGEGSDVARVVEALERLRGERD